MVAQTKTRAIEKLLMIDREHDFDVIFIQLMHRGAVPLIAWNVEWSPLSKQFGGVILPHDRYGSHLNGDETVDAELERKNFDFAGQTFAEIWSGLIIDNFPVVAEYITQENSELPGEELLPQSQHWFDNHVRTSQYLLQIVKCSDVECYSPPRSSYFSLLRV